MDDLVTVLGSGSSGNAYILRDDGHSLMLDLGLPWTELQQKSDFGLASTDGALITHCHMDHCKGVKKAIDRWMHLYMSQGTADELQVTGRRVHIVEDGQTFSVGPWKVYAFEVPHDVPEPMGYFIATPSGHRILYATDLGHLPCPFSGVTHLMIEANHNEAALARAVQKGKTHPARLKRLGETHMSLDTLIRQLSSLDLRRVRKIWLLHMSDDNADEDLIVRRVRQETGKPVTVA